MLQVVAQVKRAEMADQVKGAEIADQVKGAVIAEQDSLSSSVSSLKTKPPLAPRSEVKVVAEKLNEAEVGEQHSVRLTRNLLRTAISNISYLKCWFSEKYFSHVSDFARKLAWTFACFLNIGSTDASSIGQEIPKPTALGGFLFFAFIVSMVGALFYLLMNGYQDNNGHQNELDEEQGHHGEQENPEEHNENEGLVEYPLPIGGHYPPPHIIPLVYTSPDLGFRNELHITWTEQACAFFDRDGMEGHLIDTVRTKIFRVLQDLNKYSEDQPCRIVFYTMEMRIHGNDEVQFFHPISYPDAHSWHLNREDGSNIWREHVAPTVHLIGYHWSGSAIPQQHHQLHQNQIDEMDSAAFAEEVVQLLQEVN